MNNNTVPLNATSDPGQNAFLQKREGFLLYNNTDYEFQLLYPQDWTFIEGDVEPGDYQTDIVFFEPLGEKGKHYSKKYACGEVCLAINIYSSTADTTLRQLSDDTYNNQKAAVGKSFKLLEYKTETESKLGDKKTFELLFEGKQGKREYLEKYIGVLYPDPDADESKSLLSLVFKTRDKYSDEMLPMAQTMIDSFKFTEIKK